MTTVLEIATGWLEDQVRKHDLGVGYPEEYVNKLTNYELLEMISKAIEKRLTGETK